MKPTFGHGRPAGLGYKKRAENIEPRFATEYATAIRYGRTVSWLRKDRRSASPLFPFVRAPGDVQVKYDWTRLDALHDQWSHGGPVAPPSPEAPQLQPDLPTPPRRPRGRPRGSKNRKKPTTRSERAAEPVPMAARGKD